MLTPEQKAILYKSDNFLQQAGVKPREAAPVEPAKTEDIYKKLMDYGKPVVAPTPEAPKAPTSPKTAAKKPNIALAALDKFGGPESFFGKIGNSLGADFESTLRDLVGMGVSVKNAVTDIKDLATAPRTADGKIQQKTDRSATVPLLGKVDPFFTGDETTVQAAGKMVKGGLEVFSAIEGARGLSSIPANIKTFAGAAKTVGGEIASDVSNAITSRVTKSGIARKVAAEAEQEAAKLAETFAPKLTSKEREAAIKTSKWITDPKTGEKVLSSNVKTKGKGIFKSTNFDPGNSEKEMAKRFSEEVKAGKGKVENIVANINQSSKESKSLVDTIAKENPGKVRNTKQIVSDITKNADAIKQRLVIGKDVSRQSAWQAGFDTLEQSLKDAPKTREGLVKVYRDFNKIAANIKAYEGADNIIKQSTIAISDSLRKEILKGLPEQLATQMDDALLNQHWAIQATNRLAKTGAAQVGKSSVAKSLSKDLLKYGITAGAGAVGGIVGGKLLSE